MLELCDGMVLHLAAARDVLQTNRRIRAKGSLGHLRFVVPGLHGQPKTLKLRLTGISFGIPSLQRFVFVNSLIEAVRTSVDWLHCQTWTPVAANTMVDPGVVVGDQSNDCVWARWRRLGAKCSNLVEDLEKKIAVLNETRQEMLAGLEREQPCTVEQEGPVRRKLKQQLLRNTERRR